jgi:hypothetical protein
MVMARASRSSRSAPSPRGGPPPPADPQQPAPGRAAGADRCRGDEPSWRATEGVGLHEHAAAGGGRESTTCIQHAAGADVHQAVGQDMREEPTEQLLSVEARGAWPGTAGFAGGEGHGAVRERDETAMRERHVAVIRGAGCQGGVGVGRGRAVDVPGERPEPWVALLQEVGLAPCRLPHGAGDGGEGGHGDQEVRSGGPPGRAGLGEAAARDDGMEAGMGRELSAPGRQEPGKPRESGPDARRVLSEPWAGRSRGGAQGLGREAWMRAEQRAQGHRDGAGEAEGWSGQLGLQVVG